MEKIQFIMTGGTIDSVWNGAKDTIVVSDKSVLPDYFHEINKNLAFYEEIHFTEICLKDSRQITEADRKAIVQAIENSDSLKIIVTHGTYTMPDTACYIKTKLGRNDQTIVLTGSMVPIKSFDFSDGPFNIGYAFAQVQALPPGVYVCMNAMSFTSEEVHKNVAEGKFYSVFHDTQ